MIKGYQVFWNVQLMKTTRKKIRELGFGDHLPENSFKSRLRRACKMATDLYGERDEDNKQNYTCKLIRNKNPRCSTYEIVQLKSKYSEVAESGGELDLERICQITVDRTTGVLKSSTVGERPINSTFQNEISDNYIMTEELVDTQEFLKVVRSYLKDVCYRVSLRPSGGIYYVDDKRKDELNKLVDLFDQFPNAQLFMTTVLDDPTSNEAIKEATFRELDSTILDLKKEISHIPKSGTINEGSMNKREEKVASAKKLLNEHYSNLDERRVKLEKTISLMEKACREAEWDAELNTVNGDDFLKLLREASE